MVRKSGRRRSEIQLDQPQRVKLTARVAALLPEQPDPRLRDRPYEQKPYWHLERARQGDGRKVPVEVVVNGEAVARRLIVADGTQRELEFEVQVEKSSWIALRILPSSHTNPVFVKVAGRPIRASKRSAKWCLDAVQACWHSKMRRIRQSERAAARAAYQVARDAYSRILAECDDD